MRDPEVERKLDGFQISGGELEARAVEITEALAVDEFFDAGNAVVVDIGEAEHMGGKRSVRIDALVFRHEDDAWKAKPEDFLALLGRDGALDPDKALARPQALAQLARIQPRQHGGEKLDGFILVDDAARLRKNRHGLHVGCQHVAIAVDHVRT